MRLLSIKTPQDVAERWKQRNAYRGGWTSSKKLMKYSGKDFEKMYYQLLEAKTIEETEEIIGNKSWSTYPCDCCGKYLPEVVEIPPAIAYETVCVCEDCLKKTLELFDSNAIRA